MKNYFSVRNVYVFFVVIMKDELELYLKKSKHGKFRDRKEKRNLLYFVVYYG